MFCRYNPISEDSFNAEVMNKLYDPNVNIRLTDDPLLSHRLSLMFIVLAIGTLMDTTQDAYNTEAEKYNQLARAALFQSAFFDCPTIHAVQALVRFPPRECVSSSWNNDALWLNYSS